MSVSIQTGPAWKPVLTASVLFAPVSEPMITRARRAYFEVINGLDANDANAPAVDLVSKAAAVSDALGAFCRSLVQEGVRDWKGVINEETKKPLEFTPDHLTACINDPEFGPALSTAYAIPVWLRELEKNGSSPSRAGAIAGSKATKPKARRSTARDSATAVPAGRTASRTPTGKAKGSRHRPAPSSATPAKPTKAKPSGT